MDDWSFVTSLAAVERHIEQGRLVKAFLLPLELGGPDAPENTVYVPPGLVERQRGILEPVERLMRNGLVIEMSVRPQYHGASLVPARIVYHARHSHDPGRVTILEIW